MVIIAACLHPFVIAHTLQEGERALCVTFRDVVAFFLVFGALRGGGLLNYPPPTCGCVLPNSGHGSPMTLVIVLHVCCRRLAVTAPNIKTCAANAVAGAPHRVIARSRRCLQFDAFVGAGGSRGRALCNDCRYAQVSVGYSSPMVVGGRFCVADCDLRPWRGVSEIVQNRSVPYIPLFCAQRQPGLAQVLGISAQLVAMLHLTYQVQNTL